MPLFRGRLRMIDIESNPGNHLRLAIYSKPHQKNCSWSRGCHFCFAVSKNLDCMQTIRHFHSNLLESEMWVCFHWTHPVPAEPAIHWIRPYIPPLLRLILFVRLLSRVCCIWQPLNNSPVQISDHRNFRRCQVDHGSPYALTNQLICLASELTDAFKMLLNLFWNYTQTLQTLQVVHVVCANIKRWETTTQFQI